MCWCTLVWGQAPNTQHDRMIVIGVDGLSVDGVEHAATPRLHELMSRAAWTLEARGVMPTLSSPNWESVITGAGTEQHGITSNGYLRHMVEVEPVCRNSAGMFPTIFAALRAQRPTSRIAIFHDWPGFADLLEKDAPDVLKHERGAARTTDAATGYWEQNRPDLMFVHLDNVDHAGHEVGWATPGYYQAVAEADRYVGRFMDMLERLGASDSTYILITSDHGGKGRNHGKNSLAEIQIPWILAGPGVVPGHVRVPVYTFDTAATIAWVLGFNPSQCAIGRPVLAAFSPVVISERNAAGDTPGRECAPERSLNSPVGSLAMPGQRDVQMRHNQQH